MEKEKDKSPLKEFKLSTWSIRNKMTVYVILFIIFLAGVSSYLGMPREAFPEISAPEVYVTTPYPGNSALDIEKLVTRPIEKKLNGISEVDDIISNSLEGYSTIDVKFDFSVTPDEALRKVKDKVDEAKADKNFPKDLPADPNVFKLNFAEMMPIMNINLSGDFSMDQLKKYGEYLQDEIEALSEISEVNIRGVQDKEMEISLDLYKMELLKLNFNDIANAIKNENVTVSAGEIKEGGLRKNVRVEGEFKNAKEISNIIVKREKQKVVYLRDIATVAYKEQEKESYARQYGKAVVMLDVKKRGGENLINASEKIDKIISKAKAEIFPSNLIISKTNDMSNQTETQVSDLENSIILGMLLVIGVLMFFLGLRNALFVGIAIPMSMFLSFIVLSAMGVTLNTMVLFSLILALGMLVDNGIVVVENIYRLMDEKGYSAFDAARYGVGEVAMPIIASTATTLAAFIPLAFWPGIIGEFMKYLPITLIIVLSSSLFVALVINPMLTSVYMKLEEKPVSLKKRIRFTLILIIIGTVIVAGGLSTHSKALVAIGNLSILAGALGFLNTKILVPATRWFQRVLLPRTENLYERFLRFALSGKKPIAFFGGTLLLLVFSIFLFGTFPPNVEFFPNNAPKQIYVYSEFPIGTDIEQTNKFTKELEKKVINYLNQYKVDGTNFMVTSVIEQVGEGTGDTSRGQQGGKTPNKSKVTIDFVDFQDRVNPKTGEKVSSQNILNDIRKVLGDFAGVKIVVAKNSEGPPTGAPINLEISGDDYFQLMQEANNIKDFINNENIAGIEGLKIDVNQGKPELPLVIDRQKARRLNISTGQIANALRTALYGLEVSTFKDGEDDYPINIRLMDKYRYNQEALLNQKITFRDQADGGIIKQIPISSVAKFKSGSTFDAVKRKNLKRVITVYSNVIDGYNGNDIVAKIDASLKKYKTPAGISFAFTGEQEKQAENLAFLLKALLIAVMAIFLILVGQFNSTSTPFIISMSVLLSLIGVFLGLVIFRMDFIIIMSMLGIISLAGIVVNNAIVLIDYTNLIMCRKRDENNIASGEQLPINLVFESIVEGGKTRLRPVLLTAITTVLGLVPLALGINIDFIGLFTAFSPNIYMGGENVMFWGPLAWTVIFGLTFATFLTLVVVPVMYYLLNGLKILIFTKKQAKQVA
ncbi:MAG: efflux RND transporter permease subunit [Flavobacteriaceae bacterium]|nr:efflux RND transporter permease subunit [Flavobacteriaceae bacterium]